MSVTSPTYQQDFMMNGMRFSARPGKCDGDEKLYVDTAKLIPIEMCHVAVITHRVCCNEDRKYPRRLGYQGGNMFLDFLTHAAKEGPVAALAAFDLKIPQSLRSALS